MVTYNYSCIDTNTGLELIASGLSVNEAEFFLDKRVVLKDCIHATTKYGDMAIFVGVKTQSRNVYYSYDETRRVLLNGDIRKEIKHDYCI